MYKSKMLEIFGGALVFLILPQITFADGITDIIDAAFNLVNNVLVPLAFAVCLLYFFWGVAKYIRTGAGSDKSNEEGKRVMVWGVVGLFIALSIWGIITFIQNDLNILPVPMTTGS